MPEGNNSKKWLPIGEAARYLGVSVDTLRRWEKAGRLKPFRSPTNRRFYTKKLLNQVLDNKPQHSASAPVPKKRQIAIALITLVITIIIAYLIQSFLL
jgi:excisionase family DNA binding protein